MLLPRICLTLGGNLNSLAQHGHVCWSGWLGITQSGAALYPPGSRMGCFVHSGVGTSAWATSCVLPLLPLITSGCVIFVLWCRCFLLGLLAACYPCYCACLCPLCSKTYSTLVWPLMLVLLIGCYPYCCCTMHALLQDTLLSWCSAWAMLLL